MSHSVQRGPYRWYAPHVPGGRFPPGMLLLPALAVALLVATGLRNARREADADPAAPRVGDTRPMGKGTARG